MTVVVLKTLFILFVVLGAFLPLITWIERKQSALMQDRVGANRADILGITVLGLLHPAADVLKLLAKEDVVPKGASRALHLLAPALSLVPAITVLAVLPFGSTYRFGDFELSLVVADIDWGILFVFAMGALSTYGAIVAGWASNNNWSLLGSMRASSQMISYAVTMGLAAVGLFMVYGSLQLPEMAAYQDDTFRVLGFVERFGWVPALPAWLDWVRLPAWGVFLQPVGFVLFLTCILAENKRPPFDAPEGESELVAGYHLEYSGMRFGLFYTAEFLEVPVIGMLVTTLFLGGWSIPYLSQEAFIGGVAPVLGVGFATGLCLLVHVAAFFAKTLAMVWLLMALRWTLPRFRYDQVMDLCWKTILPLSLLNIAVTAVVLLWLEAP